jgi:hypothetical protein
MKCKYLYLVIFINPKENLCRIEKNVLIDNYLINHSSIVHMLNKSVTVRKTICV